MVHYVPTFQTFKYLSSQILANVKRAKYRRRIKNKRLHFHIIIIYTPKKSFRKMVPKYALTDLMPLYGKTGGEEDADSQGDMTNTFCCLVDPFRVQAIILQG